MAKFAIQWGVPEMADLWKDLSGKADSDKLSGGELELFKKLVKTATFLAENPAHPGLNSHEIADLTHRYGERVWQSYLENRKPAAGRLYWMYGPGRGVITVIGLEPHPERGGYARVRLSRPRGR